MTTETNISSICKLTATSKQNLRRKIWAQWKKIISAGNVITPSLVYEDAPRSGDIHLESLDDDVDSVMRTNDIFVVGEEDIISQAGYVFPIKDVKKALMSSIDGEMMLVNEEYEFNAWFVKLESN